MTKLKKLLGYAVVSFALFASGYAMAEVLDTPYKATYKVKFKGFSAGDASHHLQIAGDKLRFKASAKLSILLISGFIEEECQALINDGKIESQFYSFEQDLPGNDKKWKREFDWKNRQVFDPDAKQETDRVEAGVSDPLCHQLLLRQAVGKGQKQIPLQAISDSKVKTYEYKFVGLEDIKTALGPVKTFHLKVERNKRVTEFWLSDSHQLIPMRIKQTLKGKSHLDLTIKSLKIGVTQGKRPQNEGEWK